ncbi:MAG TPA: hypothetical protein PJ988_10345 [Anaerolinea sp.]|nr:hypothetical protein [Anaerolinea sp.]
MSNWKTLASRTVLDAGKWLNVEDRTVQTPTGEIIENWPWVTSPNYVNVLAVTPRGQYLVFRQGKYAQRELLEETGYAAAEWLHLGQFWVDPNRGVALGDLFLARGAHRVAQRNADDLEEQHLLLLERAELLRALQTGQFKVLAWAANIALALLHTD